MMKSISTLILASLFSFAVGLNKLKSLYEWKYVDLDWPSDDVKQSYIDQKLYIPENIALYDVDVSQDNRVFVTAVRTAGVPAVLMEVTDKQGDGGPLLRPYPDFDSQDAQSGCDNLISVYRIAFDSCNQLWVLDSGKIDDETVCPPKLLIYDLDSNEIADDIPVSSEYVTNKDGAGLLVTPLVLTQDSYCQQQTIFIADTEGGGLIVYQPYPYNKIQRFENDRLSYDSSAENITIAGDTFTIHDGILDMALSSPASSAKEHRFLYFSRLASYSIGVAVVDTISPSTTGTGVFGQVPDDSLPNHVSTIALAGTGDSQVLFYSQLETTSIYCWKTDDDFAMTDSNLIDQDETALQFPSGMKVRMVENIENFYTLTNRYQKVATKTLNTEETNFRILTAPIKELIDGTACL